jgi:hypothetical protein
MLRLNEQLLQRWNEVFLFKKNFKMLPDWLAS